MKELICVVCPMGCHLEVDIEDDYKTSGNQCKRGIDYAREELTAPKRIVTSTVKVEGGLYNRISVKTSSPIPKAMVFQCMEEINKIKIEAPVRVGQVLLEDILGTGTDIVATRNM